MDNGSSDGPNFADSGISFDFLNQFNLDDLDLEREAKYVGALTGSVIGSFVSGHLSWSLGLRVVSVISGSYTGAFLGALAYKILEELAAEDEGTD